MRGPLINKTLYIKRLIVDDVDVGNSVGISIQGFRKTMEDTFIMKSLDSQSQLFAVFDGHGGDGCAEFMRLNFVDQLKDNKSWQDYMNQDIEDLTEFSNHMVKFFTKFMHDMDYLFYKSRDISDVSGTTANITIILPKYIVCVNVGDSRNIIFDDTGLIFGSVDHKPNNELERKRIDYKGASIIKNKIVGRSGYYLALSRALGDYHFKNIALYLEYEKYGSYLLHDQLVIPTPDVKVFKKNHQKILLASDGLWDVMTNEQVYDFMKDSHSNEEMNGAIRCLMVEALEAHTRDNLTILYINVF